MAAGVPSDPSQLSAASPLRPQVASRRGLLTSFFLLLVAVAATIGLFYRALVSVVDNEARVNQTYDVLSALDGALATLTDAETGQRGYLFTGRESYLEPYRFAVASVGAHLAEVRRLTQDSPRQQELAGQLAEKAGAKLGELERTVAAALGGKMEDARAIVLSNDGKRLMDELRLLVASMKREEETRLAEQHAASAASARRATGTVFLAGGSLIGLLLLFYVQIRRADALGVRLLEAERVGRTQAEQVSASERRMRTELEQVNQIKDQFLATVSHELRTPLNAMLGWSRMLRIADKPEMFARGLDSIERNAKAQAQLVEDLLDVSRIIAGKMQLQAHPVDLRGVVRQAVDVVKPAADAKGIAITTECDADACRVHGDADRLQQIVWNLLSNAVKFTPANGRVGITCTKAGSDAFVSVTDTGKGIPATFLPHLFEPFRQLDGSATRSEGGLGLGLAIVRSLVELHGGSIRVTSGGQDTGATFTVQLPALGVQRDAVPTAPRRTFRLPPLTNLRVLVVDDQPDTLDVVSTMLLACDADVRTCGNAADGFATARTWRPDVLIADLAMPGEDGYSLIRKLRALSPSEGGMTPAIALTAHAQVEDRLQALSAGFSMHVPKPVEPDELASIVASLAGRETT